MSEEKAVEKLQQQVDELEKRVDGYEKLLDEILDRLPSGKKAEKPKAETGAIKVTVPCAAAGKALKADEKYDVPVEVSREDARALVKMGRAEWVRK